MQKSRRKSVTTTTTTTTTSTSGDDDDDEDGDDDNDKESRTATRRSASQASTGSPMKKSAKKEQSSQNSKNGGKKSASSKNKRSTNSLKENSGEYLGMDGGTNNINRKQKQIASIATNLSASNRCVPDKTYGTPKTSMTAQQTAVNEKSKSESLHNGTSSPLRKVNRTPSGVSAANKNSKNRKTDILNRAIGEILKAGKNSSSSPSHLSRSAKKSSSSGVKFVTDDFDEDLADVEDELDEDEDYKSLKVKKSKKKLSSNQEKEKISSAVLNGKKSNASALLTSQKRLSSDKKTVNGNSDRKKQTVAAVTTISPKTTTVSNNSSPTKKKQSPVEVISSSYTLKPVYRRAAANKASDKIAKEASKATKNSDEDLSELSSDCDGDKDQKHQTTKQPNHRINSRYGHHLHFFHFFLSYPTLMSRCHRLVR